MDAIDCGILTSGNDRKIFLTQLPIGIIKSKYRRHWILAVKEFSAGSRHGFNRCRRKRNASMTAKGLSYIAFSDVIII